MIRLAKLEMAEHRATMLNGGEALPKPKQSAFTDQKKAKTKE